MTARPAAAESFLALLDDLAGAKARPSGAAAAVMLAHAATHLRDLLDRVRELEVVDCDIVDDDEAAGVLELAAGQCPEHGVLCKGAGCCCADRHPEDVPRPGSVAERLPVADEATSGPGHADLSHLPPMVADGQDMCRAESARNPNWMGAYWDCTARRGHPERWHAAHDWETRQPYAARHQDAAWPVAARETGLPNQAFEAALECGAADGSRWACNAVQGHAPLDHVTFADDAQRRTAGAVLARWASVHPGACTHGGDCPLHPGIRGLHGDIDYPLNGGDVRRDGMGAQGEAATGTTLPGANPVPPDDAMCWHSGDHPGLPAWDCGEPLPAPGDPENRCNAEKDGLICTAGAGHAPADQHVGHGPGGEVIGHWRPGTGTFRHLAPVPEGPAGIGGRCTCLPGYCAGEGCDACAEPELELCYLDQEVTT